MCFGDRIRALDIFGKPIGLTYKDSHKFKTRIGGSVCLLIIIVMGSLLLTDLIAVINDATY